MNIKLTYFKDSGKFYTVGSTLMDLCSFDTIVNRVRGMHAEGKLPGLADGAGTGMFVLIEGGPNGVPHLLRPVEE